MESEIVVGEASLRRVDDREEREAEIGCATTHRRTESAKTPKTFVLSVVVSYGSQDRKEWGTELHFGGCESFDDHHRAGTLRTAP